MTCVIIIRIFIIMMMIMIHIIIQLLPSFYHPGVRRDVAVLHVVAACLPERAAQEVVGEVLLYTCIYVCDRYVCIIIYIYICTQTYIYIFMYVFV